MVWEGRRVSQPGATDVVVIGAGIVGAACAYELASAGLTVTVLDRGPIVAGTSGAGEGNILVSDKAPGPELDISLLSNRRWRELAQVLPAAVELEPKGGLMVATDDTALPGLGRLATEHRSAGLEVVDVAAAELVDYEPHLATDLAGGRYYPQDMQVLPMVAAAHLLRLARRLGALVLPRHEVVGIARSGSGAVRAVVTPTGEFPCGAVVNAAGTWAADIATLAGSMVPVEPRRGFILVTEPLPRVVRHKVYTADYLADIASDAAGLRTSAVVEGTASGPVLVGASRERVGFEGATSYPVLARLAQQAIRLFPVLAGVRVLRTYHGFRPYSPDHLPIIGPDSRVPGLFHACGHEGGGIGQAPATALLVAQSLSGATPALALDPYLPRRFQEVA